MWIAYQRARIHITIPCWMPLTVILMAFYVVSLRKAAKKCLMARFCQNWLDSTFCWDISSWQSCVGTCSMHQWFFKWGSGWLRPGSKMIFASSGSPARFAEFAWTARVTIVTWNQDRVVRERHPPFWSVGFALVFPIFAGESDNLEEDIKRR